jgi:hypothetical protein
MFKGRSVLLLSTIFSAKQLEKAIHISTLRAIGITYCVYIDKNNKYRHHLCYEHINDVNTFNILRLWFGNGNVTRPTIDAIHLNENLLFFQGTKSIIVQCSTIRIGLPCIALIDIISYFLFGHIGSALFCSMARNTKMYQGNLLCTILCTLCTLSHLI